MFRSVLVANRGEIACRIFRTAERLGLATVAVYSDADVRAKHVREAASAVHIGAGPAAESYLQAERIIAAAKQTGAEAIHPGYGFLSENPAFAEAVIAAGLVWIGPTPHAIRAMGLKDEAKRIAIDAGVPVLAGYQGDDQSATRLARAAKEVGFPVLIKAVAGGGGRGIREVRNADEFKTQLESAQREAKAAFGNDVVLIEKLVERPRHIEVQVFGDKHGNIVHLFERDCSLQRRRQKVIEEAPAPGMTDKVRAAMTAAAVKLASEVGYENAGTVEFIVDGTGPLREDGFWFLEMNTRLQVEHPVTEAITGLDLVEWQLRVAAGQELPKLQPEIAMIGHAIEARLCAEDPDENFRPSVGRLEVMALPSAPGVRVDSGFEAGDTISPLYDSMIAKLIVHASNRGDALAMAAAALEDACIAGVTTNAPFLAALMRDPIIRDGAMDVGLIGREPQRFQIRDRSNAAEHALAIAECLALGAVETAGPWGRNDGFRLNAEDETVIGFDRAGAHRALTVQRRPHLLEMRDGDKRVQVVAPFLQRGGAIALVTGNTTAGALRAFVQPARDGWRVFVGGQAFWFETFGSSAKHLAADAGDDVKAPLPGKIVGLNAKLGAAVKKGEALLVLEAMKMEHTLKAPRDGVIAALDAALGAQVKEGAVLVKLEAQA
jgi:3-methylcrotonyl-CoA carboxylase alpha subunit